MKIVSVHCTGTLLTCTSRGKARSAICRRTKVLTSDFSEVPRLQRTLSGPMLPTRAGLGLVYRTTKKNRIDRRLGHFIRLMLRRQERGFLRFVVVSCVSLCQGRGGVDINGVAAIYPMTRRMIDHVQTLIMRGARKAMRFGAGVSPGLRNNFVFRVKACELSTDMTGRVGQMGRRFVTGGEEVMWGWGLWIEGWGCVDLCLLIFGLELVPNQTLVFGFRFLVWGSCI